MKRKKSPELFGIRLVQKLLRNYLIYQERTFQSKWWLASPLEFLCALLVLQESFYKSISCRGIGGQEGHKRG